MLRRIAFLSVMVFVLILALGAYAPARADTGGVECWADPTTTEVGGLVTITCTGFTPNTLVNAYVVEPTGFSEVGRSNYSACLVGTRVPDPWAGISKSDEGGTAVFLWYTQNGVNSCPTDNYDGYANQLGSYQVVVQELDGKGGVKGGNAAWVTLYGPSVSYSGAHLVAPAGVYVGDWFTITGSGFAPNEYVNIWFTRPVECSGLGWWYWTGVSSFNPEEWDGAGIFGPGSVKTDESGSFAAIYLAREDDPEPAYPCLGKWKVTANALGSGQGYIAEFEVMGRSVATNAHIWLSETSIPSIGQTYDDCCGVGVYVSGSGFPAGSQVNCWFTRPDGTVYDGYRPYSDSSGTQVGADGGFTDVFLTWTSAVGYQGEQPGWWKVSCGTPDGKYNGIAEFLVYPLPFLDP